MQCNRATCTIQVTTSQIYTIMYLFHTIYALNHVHTNGFLANTLHITQDIKALLYNIMLEIRLAYILNGI